MEIFRDSVVVLKAEFNIKNISRSEEVKVHKVLSSFHSFESAEQVVLQNAFKIGNHFLALLSVNYLVIRGRQRYTETLTDLEFAGLGKLNVDLKKTFIRRETLQDKIQELFIPVEVDFDHNKTFSRKYFVLTNDPQNLKDKMPSKLMDIINEQREIEVEINGRNLLVRNYQRITQQGALDLAKFLSDLDEV